jgi:hypothetical protein
MPTKPTISVRPPPPVADPVQLAQSFVEKSDEHEEQRESVKTSRRKGVKTPKTVVTRTDGRVMKRLTVWMPNDLAVRLSVQCAGEQRDVSSALSEAAESWLKGR